MSLQGRVLTFFFTDIEGSTRLWERHPEAMPGVIEQHDQLISRGLEQHGGELVKHTGDGVFAVFQGDGALQAAINIQRALRAHTWGVGELRVRMALHTGRVEHHSIDYFGRAVNRAARLSAVAWGGQIVLTPEVKLRAALPGGAWLKDLGEHVLKDLGEPQQIFQLMHPDLPADFPPLRSLSGRPNNLPRQNTPFIGREAELRDLRELLVGSDCRLATLTGPGGAGKTRLALQVAAEAIEAFPHGVFFVPLSSVTSTGSVISAIGGELGLPSPQSGSELEQVLHYLTRREILLVLDNFEHLLGAAPLVAELLDGTQNLRVLATSQERLNLRAECLYELGGLPVPGQMNGAAVRESDSVRLFLAYAHRTRPDYEPTPAEMDAIAEICRIVNGMPLALEMAAGWLRTLSPVEIVAELEADLDFLATTLRDVPERHRSIRAVFEHSWALLSAEEQQALARLSVFRGSFTREAAMQVAGVSLPTFSTLTDKSLLRREPGGRYLIHGLLRQFAREKLRQDAAEYERLFDRHCMYYSALLHELEALVHSPRAKEAQATVADDRENVVAAWQWAIERVRADDLFRMSYTMETFYQFQSRFVEGAELFDRAAERLSRLEPTGSVARAYAAILVHVGWFAIRLGKLRKARAALERSLAIYEAQNLRPAMALGSHPMPVLALTLSLLGEYDLAVKVGEEALRRFDSHPDELIQTLANYVMAGIYRAVARYDDARRVALKAYRLTSARGEYWFLAYCLNELADVATALEDYEEARKYYRQSYEIRKTFDDPEGQAVALSRLAGIAMAQHEYEDARRLYNQAADIYEEIADRGGLARSLWGLGGLQTTLGRYAEASAHLHRALTMAVEMRYLPLQLNIVLHGAELLLATGSRQAAARLLAFVADHPSAEGETRTRAREVLHEHGIEAPAAPPASANEVVAGLLEMLGAGFPERDAI